MRKLAIKGRDVGATAHQGIALTFIVVGSIAGASGIVLQMAGEGPNAVARSEIAAIPLNPGPTLSTVVSPAFPAALGVGLPKTGLLRTRPCG